ncbi:MAG: type IV pilus secretin PilQ [Gammaproteobacteria bacterium]|nr:type IV pilus secretin PilQ [Gammaproteobacteria bacterium]
MKNLGRTNQSKKGLMTSPSRLSALGFSALVALALPGLAWSAEKLQDIDYNILPGDKVEVRLVMSGPVAEPRQFTTDNPARIALDFEGVSTALASKNVSIGTGVARSVTAVEAQGRTRVVLNLLQLVPYDVRTAGNEIVVALGASKTSAVSQAVSAAPAADAGAPAMPSSASGAISGVDFRRGDKGEARVVVQLADPATQVDLRQEGRTVIADFMQADIADELIRKLDVVDFATPARTVETSRHGDKVRFSIEGGDDFEYLAYQADNSFTIELRPLTPEEVEKRKKDKFAYSGERMSLNFQNIEVRSVLQLIADFTGLNMVTSDTVGGNITLRLQNVPWDQALDIILKTRGLDKRQSGNVLLVAPAEEIAAREKLELQNEVQQEKLSLLRTEYVQVNYAKASDLANLLKQASASAGEAGNSLLSERGSVTVDERTNTLLVQDTSGKLEEIRGLVRRLDVPVRQVLIESRIVNASNTAKEDLGVRFGVSDQGSQVGVAGSLTGAEAMRNTGTSTASDRLNVNLPTSGAAGSIGFNIARLTDGTILDLELSALESEGRGEIIASPRLMTANQREAYIESGEEIPYREATSSGAASVSFKKAVLSLKVKPQITPDERVIMDLTVNQDRRGVVTDGIPAIDTREIGTQVLVDNGQTVVLGGIFEQTKTMDKTKVPVLGDLPAVGWLFRRTNEVDNKTELLIFVTPKIVKEAL